MKIGAYSFQTWLELAPCLIIFKRRLNSRPNRHLLAFFPCVVFSFFFIDSFDGNTSSLWFEENHASMVMFSGGFSYWLGRRGLSGKCWSFVEGSVIRKINRVYDRRARSITPRPVRVCGASNLSPVAHGLILKVKASALPMTEKADTFLYYPCSNLWREITWCGGPSCLRMGRLWKDWCT